MTTAPKITPTPAPRDEDLADLEPTRRFSDYVREHPGAFIAGGVVLGLVVGALLPRKTGSALTKRAMALAATAGELGLVASRHVRDGAERAAHEAKDLIDRDSVIVREKAGQLASAARDTGQRVADRASDLAARLRH